MADDIVLTYVSFLLAGAQNSAHANDILQWFNILMYGSYIHILMEDILWNWEDCRWHYCVTLIDSEKQMGASVVHMHVSIFLGTILFSALRVPTFENKLFWLCSL